MNRFAILVSLLLCSATPALAVDNLVLDNEVVSTGQVLTYSARTSIAVGPAYAVQAGGDVTLASQRITLTPGTQVLAGGKLRLQIGTAVEFNTSPTATDDSAIVAEGGSIIGNVLTNDSDGDGDILSGTLLTQVSHGTLLFNSDGAYTYSHDGGETTTDSFTYAASDGLSTSQAMVSLTITPVNDPPQAVADQATVQEDSLATSITVLTNDFDVDPGDTFVITNVTIPSHGGTAVSDGLSIAYTPAPNFWGTESFSYTISDQSGATATAQVTITVNDVPEPPISVDDSYILSEKSYNNILAVIANDFDLDQNDLLTITSISAPDQGGIAWLFPGSQKIYYTPAGDYAGLETFSYTVTDSYGMSATALVTITLTNVVDAPVASNDIVTVQEESLDNIIDALANDYDPDAGDGLTITAVGTANQGGTVVIAPDGSSLTYTPLANFNGLEEFSYTITDLTGRSHDALVIVTVSPENDAPQATADTFSVDDDSQNTILNVLDNDHDVDGDQLTITAVTLPNQSGSVAINGNTLVYSPLANYTGVETFSYTVSDSGGLTASGLVTVEVVNTNYPPQPVRDTATTQKNEPVIIDVLTNDTDLDNDQLTVTAVSIANHGAATINADNTITYQPALDHFGLDAFSYTVSDGSLDTASALVSITIMPPASQVPTDLILENMVVANGQSPEYYATNSISAAPNYTVQTGGSASMTSKRITLRPGFKVEQGGSLTVTAAQIVDNVPTDLDLQNITVATGESHNYEASNSIYAAPAFEIQTGGTTTMKSGTITLRPGFTVRAGGALTITTPYFEGDYVVADSTPPTIISGWPGDDVLVGSQGGSLTYLVTYGNNGASLKTVILYDGDGNDITSQATVTDNTIELVIDPPQDREYLFKLFIGDSLDNVLVDERSFTVDTSVPITVSSLTGGLYNEAINVELTCSEEATIYYSTDGYPPFVGAANTTAVAAPANDIRIKQNTNLQYFAMDTAGNIETTQSEVYYIGAIPGEATTLSATYNDLSNQVELAWPAVPFATSTYQLYRCNNAFDCAILDESRTGGYAPPQKLQIASLTSTANTHNDISIIAGATYSYGISITGDQNVEGVISELVQVIVPATTPTADKTEALVRGTSWLEQNQGTDGSWGSKKSMRILATGQALRALNLSGKDNAGIRQGLFWLRGNFADNNDYLSRQILALSDYEQNVDEAVNRLISQADISGVTITGWGSQKQYQIDALDTALGSLALARNGRQLSLVNGVYDTLKDQPTILSAEVGKFGWVNGKAPSVYVSALTYNTVDGHFTTLAPVFDPSWVLTAQNTDGSYGAGIIDTTAVLIWLPPDITAQDNAINYLVSQQELNGSWLNDPYITGLCLEALEAN